MQPIACPRRHAYPQTDPGRPTTPWWYYGRALYVSRRDYFKIYCALMLTLGFPLVFLALYFDWQFAKIAALGAGTVSLFYLGYSLLGLYRMYGHPGRRYVRRLLDDGGAGNARVIADLHIGTYRHSYVLAKLLPGAVIHSIDCWGVPGDPHEIAIRDVRDLEHAPTHNPRIRPQRTNDYTLPLPDASCDAVVFGFGTHEIPDDGPLNRLFLEAKRVLKPGGKVLMFEHGNDFHNVIIFGPVIGHVVSAIAGWTSSRPTSRTSATGGSWQAVDLFWGTKAAADRHRLPTVAGHKGRRANPWIWVVIATFTLISAAVVVYLPESGRSGYTRPLPSWASPGRG